MFVINYRVRRIVWLAARRRQMEGSHREDTNSSDMCETEICTRRWVASEGLTNTAGDACRLSRFRNVICFTSSSWFAWKSRRYQRWSAVTKSHLYCKLDGTTMELTGRGSSWCSLLVHGSVRARCSWTWTARTLEYKSDQAKYGGGFRHLDDRSNCGNLSFCKG